MPCNVDVGGLNEMWRHHRSELRPPHSDFRCSDEGERNVCYVLAEQCLFYVMCHINLVNAVISVIVALDFLTNQRRLMLFVQS